MKKIILKLALLVVFFTLISCSGSDAYRGVWKAKDMNGEKFEIVFQETSFSIKDTANNLKDYSYSQNSVNIKNSTSTYGIKVSNDKSYNIHFPNTSDNTTCLLMDENNNPIYVLNRNSFMNYEDIYELN